MDRIYLKNRIMSRVGEEGLDAPTQKEDLIALKDQLVEIAVANSKIQDSMAAKDSLGAELMDWITPSPSQVNHRFWETYRQSKEDAIADFYALSKRNDYIKVKAIAQNIAFETQTPYGSLEITINLSKPEKDPKDIAAAKLAKASHYPACQLCFENEGYQGRGPITGLFALIWTVMTGASSIPLMPTSMNTAFSSIASMFPWPLVARPLSDS